VESDFRSRLKKRRPLVGTIVTLACQQTVEILSGAGFDWLFVDGEHAALGAHEIEGILMAANGRCPCAVRIPANEEIHIKHSLDSGAAGIIAPNVNTAETAIQVIDWAKYPPLGRRSVGISRAHGYGMDFEGYMAGANSQTAVIVQLEHRDGVENIDAILDVEGVDAIFIGPYDLSASCGKPGELSDPEVLTCIKRVRDRCLKRNVPVGIFTTEPKQVKPYMDEGYTLVALSMDIVMLGRSAKALLDQTRQP
jgi:2-dehydro-3-deoxyglucarate aldolase/4-hydroxy-2-oxoheptanedioate aldolase